MCGIAGVVEWAGRPIDPTLLTRMGCALRHRGPDEEGTYLHQADPKRHETSIGLSHTRLSIIDLVGGRQPMSNEDETVWIVFNGEIFNYQPLRQELIRTGHQFRTESDTEVILQAYLAYGVDCVRRLHGMFAFAIWDAGRQRLLLARDREGKKPLVYTQRGNRFVFASELQALLQDPEIPTEVNWEAIHHYLTLLCIPAPWTAFREVWKLLPAHVAVVERGQLRLERYWSPDPTAKRRMSVRRAAEELIERMRDSVRLRLISDVPVGAFLSGGIDSSIVVSEMAKACREPVQTFSIGFREAPFNELPAARLVAQRYRTRHTEFTVSPDAAAVMPRLIRHYGEPFADSSAIPTYYLAQCARQFVKVALSGDGGDELFGGYYRHLAMRWADRYARLPALIRSGLTDPLIRHWPSWLELRSGRLSLRRFLGGLRHSRQDRLFAWMAGFDESTKRMLYRSDSPLGANGCETRTYFDGLWQAVESLDGVDAMTWVDFQWYLPSDLLTKMDIASMAHGLEVRAPWLDHHLIEFALQIPAALKVRGATLKYLPRYAWRNELPREILSRRKQGFAVPLAAWLRGPLRDWMMDLVASSHTQQRGLLDARTVARLVDDHLDGRRDLAEPLWALMMLELWFRTFIDAPVHAGRV